MSSTEIENVIFVYSTEDFQKVYKQFGNQRGVWIIWADKGELTV